MLAGMTPTLMLHGRLIASVFDLLGIKENDIRYSLSQARAGIMAPRVLAIGK